MYKIKIYPETLLTNKLTILNRQLINRRDEECRCLILCCIYGDKKNWFSVWHTLKVYIIYNTVLYSYGQLTLEHYNLLMLINTEEKKYQLCSRT